MDAVNMGKTFDADQGRDAIHVAVLSVVAAENLTPGQHIGFFDDGRVGAASTPIGIVDPFLKNFVPPGQGFWMMIYPGTITGLRHNWAHPEVSQSASSAPAGNSSTEWLEDFAATAGLSYDRMMSILNDYIHCGEVWVEQGGDQAQDAYYALENDGEDLWKHYAAVSGVKNPGNQDWGAPFSCSC